MDSSVGNLTNSLVLVNQLIADLGDHRNVQYFQLLELQAWLMVVIRELYGEVELPTFPVYVRPSPDLSYSFKNTRLNTIARTAVKLDSAELVSISHRILKRKNSQEELLLLSYINNLLEYRGYAIVLLTTEYKLPILNSNPEAQANLDRVLKELRPALTPKQVTDLHSHILVTLGEMAPRISSLKGRYKVR